MKNNKCITMFFENDLKIDIAPNLEDDVNILTSVGTGEDKEVTSAYMSLKELEEYIIALADIVQFLRREGE